MKDKLKSLIVGTFHFPLLVIDRINRKKISKTIENLNTIINKLGLNGFCRICRAKKGKIRTCKFYPIFKEETIPILQKKFSSEIRAYFLRQL